MPKTAETVKSSFENQIVMVGDTPHKPELLISRKQIKREVQAVSDDILRHYDFNISNVLWLTVLGGALHFSSDLRRSFKGEFGAEKAVSDSIKLSSYGGGSQTSGVIRKLSPISAEVSGKDIIIVEDIIDSGLTMQWLTNMLENGHNEHSPRSIAVATFLLKTGVTINGKPANPRDALQDTPLFVGREIGPDFVVGYGLDYDQNFRDLPDIYSLKTV